MHLLSVFLGLSLAKNETTYQCDDLNQLISVGDSRYSYDANGNLIRHKEDDSSTTYRYDALDRLISITRDDAQVEYGYDAFNRRLSKTVSNWDAVARDWQVTSSLYYLYDGDKEIGAVDAEGNIVEFRTLGITYGAEIGSAVALEFNGAVYAPIHDHRGSLCCLIDPQTAEALASYRYSAFGEAQKDSSSLKSPWGFCSKRYDTETGLVYFGKRYYSPKFGRWITKDPLGTPDSPNRYAYVLNNPMTEVDLYGLFSLHQILDTVLDFFENIETAANTLREKVSLEYKLRPEVDAVAEQLFSRLFLQTSGYYKEQPERGVYGGGELNTKVRITLVNGMLNVRTDNKYSLEVISDSHGGVNVHYVFRPTLGWGLDLFKGILLRLGFISPEARRLANMWKVLIQEMGGTEDGGTIIHYAHSIGAVETKNAKTLLSPEEQKMIRVLTLGSPSMLSNGGFQSVTNYVSVRDIICWLDPLGYLKGIFQKNSNVSFVGNFLGLPFVDHLLTVGTYRTLLEHLGKEFLDTYYSPGEL